MKNRKSRPTQNLNNRETSWFQLASAAGTLIDRFKGEVTDVHREDLWVLKKCVERVMEIEGMTERPDTSDYEIIIEKYGEGTGSDAGSDAGSDD